ncbi:20565_t:CDS:1, partial [Gigaspora margarita]
LETDYSLNSNKFTSTNPEETTIFENNDIEWNIKNGKILKNPEILSDPPTNDNSETTLETDDLTREQSTIMTGIIKDLTDEKSNTSF